MTKMIEPYIEVNQTSPWGLLYKINTLRSVGSQSESRNQNLKYAECIENA